MKCFGESVYVIPEILQYISFVYLFTKRPWPSDAWCHLVYFNLDIMFVYIQFVTVIKLGQKILVVIYLIIVYTKMNALNLSLFIKVALIN